MKHLRLLALSCALAAWPAAARCPYPLGEQLTFQAYALGIVPIGTVWMDVSTGRYANQATYQMNGRCLGDYLVYVADVRVTSQLSQQTDHSLFHAIEQYGTERRGRQVVFDWNRNEALYTQLQKDGSYQLHKTTPITPDVWDIFGCAFHLRRNFPTAIGASTDVKLIEKDKVYQLRCTVKEKKPFDLGKLGVYEAMRVQLSPLNLKPDEVFKGLLNLDRDVVLWVETSTRTPIYMSTTVPFGIVRPTVKLVLKEWKIVPGFEPRRLPAEALKSPARAK